MPKPRRDPYVPMDATIRRNAKLAVLPTDTARLGWLYVGLGEAKLQRPSGCFRSRAHWSEVAGRFARHLKDYLATGLMEEAGALCPRCARVWPSLPAGALVVHDWKRHNTDPGAAGRAAAYRAEHPDEESPEDDDSDEWDADQTDETRRLNGHRASIERLSNGDQTGIEQSDAVYLARDPAGPRGGNRKGNQNRKRNQGEEGSTRRSSDRTARAAERPVDPSDRAEDPVGWLG